ncbi:diphosphoinositol polyphosphate phosphohydrolase 1 isoform X1 [Leguminivora glycinivorella]|uniref:diphosphoinositol polyphosphate phosphohydrolase 1 isoform X1 n=1 Tax=Leguminivora glycinivorella TaxID=1035111 RepID=UPI0020101F30|nr:diphosphoinositol polyphosphate phosphohydrolase 1 isoform X1 [Leguminivora glycinivorella]
MVKEKPNSIRIYDEEGFRRRAACICVRSDAETEVLLVTSSRRPDNWIVPGGGVEPEEEPSVTAMREVLEEAGVIGKLGRCLGVFENREHKHRTEVYVMTVTQELAEWEDARLMGRKRQWFSIDDALAQLALHKPIQRHYLQLVCTLPLMDRKQWSLVSYRHKSCVGGLMGRKRQWFSIDDALAQLALHKPIQRHYLQLLRRSRKPDPDGS